MKTLRELFRKLPSDGKLRDSLRSFNLQTHSRGKATSVKQLAETLGVVVHQVALPRGMAGRLVSDPFADSGYAIEVNTIQSVQSKRFTVLHELGHYLLHLDRSDPFAEPMYLDRSTEQFYFDEAQEREANDVADVLLFGDGTLEAAISLHGNDPDRLAHLFGVTPKMIEIAIKKFGVQKKP